MKIIARIRTDFKEKFGIPRQSGLAEEIRGRIVFEPEYRRPEALKGILGFSHLWLIWQFSENETDEWSPTVRPPRLGGNKKVGVFASRSPYRPNPIGLSSVVLLGIDNLPGEGIVLLVSGPDMLDGTPIYDIKPYLAYTDSHPYAVCGYADEALEHKLDVDIDIGTLMKRSLDCGLEGLMSALSLDPRPSYQDDPNRQYGMHYGNAEVKFTVKGKHLHIDEINPIEGETCPTMYGRKDLKEEE